MLFFGSAYFYQDPEWNGNSRLALTRAIVELGTLNIDAYHESPGWYTGDKAFFDGHYYTDKAIGTSLLAVPLLWLLEAGATLLGTAVSTGAIKHALTTGVMSATFALAGLAMYSVALEMTNSPIKAAAATLAATLGSMLWPYSAVFYGHVPAAAFLAVTFALLFSARRAEGRGNRWTWFGIGVCAGAAFLSDHTAAVVIAGLGVYGLIVLRGLKTGEGISRAWSALAGALIPLSLFFAYNLTIYGRPVAFGYTHEVEERFQDIMSLGLMGIRLPAAGAAYHISVDPRFGLFWLSPVLALAPVGYWWSFKRREYVAESLVSIFALAAIFAVNAASFLWYGGSAFGPRLLITALPFFIVPMALVARRWMGPLIILGALSAINMIIPLYGRIQYDRLEFKPDKGGFYVGGVPFNGFSLLYGYGLPEARRLAALGETPWTLGTALGLSVIGSIGALLGAEAALLMAFLRVSRARTARS
jgi:hypothetical protein